MSKIQIPLPRWPSSGTEIPGFLKQLELCVHHARKAYEVQVEHAKGIREDDYACYRTPTLDDAVEGVEGTLEDVASNLYDEHEDVVLEINVE